jgi:hypothetical protein
VQAQQGYVLPWREGCNEHCISALAREGHDGVQVGVGEGLHLLGFVAAVVAAAARIGAAPNWLAVDVDLTHQSTACALQVIMSSHSLGGFLVDLGAQRQIDLPSQLQQLPCWHETTCLHTKLIRGSSCQATR